MKLAIVMPANVSMPLISGGGVPRLCQLFIKQNESADDPCEITVISALDERSKEKAAEYNNTKFLYVPIPKSEPPSNQLKSKLFGRNMRYDYLSGVKKLLRTVEFDRLILEDCFEFTEALAKSFKIQPILHVHDDFLASVEKKHRFGITKINKFIFTSSYFKDTAVNRGVPEDLCHVVSARVDTAEFDPEIYADIRHAKREQYGLSDDDLLGIFVGRLTPEKGALELVKAMSSCEFSKKKLRLLIVGSAQFGMNVQDDYRNELEVAAAKGRVIFIGSVRSASAARFLARADFAVIPTLSDNTSPLAVLEAASSGLPIIVSDAKGFCEFTGDMSTDICTVVPRGIGYVAGLSRAVDCLAEKLSCDGCDREAISESARTHAKKFDGADYRDNLLRVICD